MTTHHNIYDGLAELMASLDPQKILAYHAPVEMQQRLETLLEKKQDQLLSAEENEELEHYFILEHIVRLAKSRSRLRLAQTRPS